MTTMKITKSKIVATLGPASFSEEKIKGLAERGMDVARINFSHGTAQDKEDLVKLIRNICPNMCILCDIQGPKIRIGNIKGNGAVLVTGEDVTVTTEHVEGDARRFTIAPSASSSNGRISRKTWAPSWGASRSCFTRPAT